MSSKGYRLFLAHVLALALALALVLAHALAVAAVVFFILRSNDGAILTVISYEKLSK